MALAPAVRSSRRPPHPVALASELWWVRRYPHLRRPSQKGLKTIESAHARLRDPMSGGACKRRASSGTSLMMRGDQHGAGEEPKARRGLAQVFASGGLGMIGGSMVLAALGVAFGRHQWC